MYWRSGLRGVLQGDIITPLVFVLICVPGALLQSTPSNPVILAPFSALEGSSVNLTCISTGGNPLPTVTWYRGNQIVDQSYRTNSFGSTTQTINDYVFNVYRNDSSVTYRCDVDNVNLGSPLMKTAILTVYVQPGPPVITGSSVLTAGSTYTHKCRTSAGGNPIPTLNWMLGNQSISNLAISRNVINLNDNTYIVEKNITWVPVASDNGKNLSCALSHNETLGSTTQLIDSFIITVQVLPNITTSITSYSRTVGDSVTLACSVVAASPSVTSVYWTKLSNSVTTNVTIDGSKFQGSTTSVPSLTINTLQTTDAGVYTCNAVNAAGTGSGLGILLSITGSAPSVSIPSSSYPVNYNANTTLICSVTATPSATGINWYKVVNGVDTLLSISGNSRLSGGTTSQPSLTVTFAVFNDEGSYKCEASNLVGATRSVATFLDVIGSSPTVTIPISSYSAVYGNSVTINCTVSASPAATLVSWQQIVNSQSTTINPTANPTKYSGSTTSTPSLTINNLVTADSGYYVCSATNPAGTTVSGQTLLTVTGTTPTVSANPTSYSENYGTNVTLQCSVSGNPAVTAVYWSKTTNGVTTDITTNTAQSSSKYSGVTVSNPSLQITSLTLSDSGSYVCFGINSVGSSQTSSVTLNVIGDVLSTSAVQSQYSVNIGNSVTLQCIVSGTPSATSITWQQTRNGATTTLNAAGSSRYTGGSVSVPSLTILSTQTTDSGTYTCVATNNVGTSSPATMVLSVTGDLPSVTIGQSSYSVTYGNSVTLNCSYTSTPSATGVSWQRTANSVSTVLSTTGSSKYSGGTLAVPSLTVFSATDTDEGFYTCSVTNAIGTASSSSAFLDVITTIPSVSIPSNSYSVNYGNSITIPCTISSNPFQSSVYWQRTTNGVTTTLSISGRYSGATVNSPALIISGAVTTDSGSYVCFATNSAGTGNSNAAVLTVVGNAPTVNIPNTQYTVTHGNSVSIPCFVSGSPSVTSISWVRISGGTTTTINIAGSSGKYSGGSTSSPSLTITNTNNNDEGTYRCSATNAVGTSQDSTFLDVQGNTPSVTISQSTYTINYGSSVTLACSVSGSPSATSVQWYKVTNSGSVSINVGGSSRYSGSSTSNPSLTIVNTVLSDEGSYQCTATNSVGTGSSSTTYLDIVASVPSVSIGSAVAVIIGNNATIQCSYTANPDATSVSWQQTSGGQTSTVTIGGRFSGGSTSDPSLKITNAQSSDEGSYRCFVTNNVGQGQSGLVFLDVQGNIPTVTLGNNTYSVVTGQSVTIDCTVSATPTQTLVYWQVSDFPGQTATNVTIDGQKYSGGTIVTPSLTITDANATLDEGYYRCFSVNAAGQGQSIQAFLDVTGNVPTVTIPSNSYSATYGNSITIPCSIASNPSASSMRWEKTANSNTDILTTTNSTKYSGGTLSDPPLTISNLNFDDQATYRCVASNQVGDGFSIATFLTVQGNAPTVSVPQNFYSALIGTNAQMPCSISANPATTSVYWLFNPTGSGNNVQISQTGGRYTVSSIANNPTLSITNVTFSDTGTYTCTAVNAVGTGNDGADFNVTGSSPSVSIAQPSYSVLTGNTITIPCTITASPSISNRYWIFDPSGSGNNEQITTTSGRYTLGANTNSPSLTISNAVAGDAGTYMCFATNLVGTTSDSATLTITGAGPTVSIPSSSYSVLQTQDVTLQCNVNNASPSVTSVTWYYSTTANNPNPSMVNITGISRYSGGTTTTPSLTITGAESGDAGYYRCSATNAVSTATSGYTSLAVTGATPSGTSIAGASSQDIDQTNTLSLTCSASGEPTPTITWSLNGQTLSSTNGVYTKVNVQRADDGVYTCTATNSLGSQTATVDVNVRYAPVATSSQQTINAATGSTQTLTCSVEANPTASYQWTRNNVVVGSSNTYTKTFGTGDFGDYICTATNTLGTATVTFTVSQSSASVGASTASGGLTTGEIAAIVLAVLLILLLIIVICICCCTHGVCGVICGKKKDPKGRVEPVKEKEVYKETIRHIEIPRFEEKPKVSPLPPIATDMSRYEKERDREGRQESFRSYPYGIYKRREHSAVSRRDVDVNVKRENDYDIVRYETVPPAGTYYGDTIISVHDDVRASPRPHRLPALTTYTYEEAERRRKHRRKKKKHRRRHDDEEVIVEKVRTASPVRVIEEVAPVRVIEEPAETVIVERVRTASPVRYVEEPAQDVIIESVRRSPSTRRKRSDEEEMIVRTSSRSPSRRRRHEERYVTTERVVNGDVYRDGGDLRAINGEVYRDSGEYSLSRHGSGRFTRESRSSRRKEYAGSDDVEVEEGSAYYVERR